MFDQVAFFTAFLGPCFVLTVTHEGRTFMVATTSSDPEKVARQYRKRGAQVTIASSAKAVA